MSEVQIFDHVSAVHELMQEDISSALRLMANCDVTDFLSEEALSEAYDEPLLASMFSLAGYTLEGAGLQENAAEKASKWSDEATYYSKRADRIERMKHAPKKLKVDSHIEAHQAHQYAAHHHRNAGNQDAAKKHEVFAQHHASRLQALSPGQEPVHETSYHSRRFQEMARLRRAKLARKHEAQDPKTGFRKKTPDLGMGFPKGEMIQNWAADLDEEGKYSDEVKSASKAAADASARAGQSGNADTHAAAHRAHFIAHHVAKAAGHTDLAAKHKSMMDKHQAAGKKAIAAS